MSPRVAGRTMFVSSLTGLTGRWGLAAVVGSALAVSVAHAEGPRPEHSAEAPDLKLTSQISFARRPVAVIDLSNDQSVRDVANKLNELLAAHSELAPPAISDGAALVDAPPLDDETRLQDAQRKRKSAEGNLAQRNFSEA